MHLLIINVSQLWKFRDAPADYKWFASPIMLVAATLWQLQELYYSSSGYIEKYYFRNLLNLGIVKSIYIYASADYMCVAILRTHRCVH